MEKQKRKNKRVKGVSTTDLLIYLAIVGILLSALGGGYLIYISKARSTEAKHQLKHLCDLQTLYFYENSNYSKSLEEIGFSQKLLASEGGDAKYLIQIVSASPTAFVGRATATDDFNGNGVINVWEINQSGKLTETIKD